MYKLFILALSAISGLFILVACGAASKEEQPDPIQEGPTTAEVCAGTTENPNAGNPFDARCTAATYDAARIALIARCNVPLESLPIDCPATIVECVLEPFTTACTTATYASSYDNVRLGVVRDCATGDTTNGRECDMVPVTDSVSIADCINVPTTAGCVANNISQSMADINACNANVFNTTAFGGTGCSVEVFASALATQCNSDNAWNVKCDATATTVPAVFDRRRTIALLCTGGEKQPASCTERKIGTVTLAKCFADMFASIPLLECSRAENDDDTPNTRTPLTLLNPVFDAYCGTDANAWEDNCTGNLAAADAQERVTKVCEAGKVKGTVSAAVNSACAVAITNSLTVGNCVENPYQSGCKDEATTLSVFAEVLSKRMTFCVLPANYTNNLCNGHPAITTDKSTVCLANAAGTLNGVAVTGAVGGTVVLDAGCDDVVSVSGLDTIAELRIAACMANAAVTPVVFHASCTSWTGATAARTSLCVAPAGGNFVFDARCDDLTGVDTRRASVCMTNTGDILFTSTCDDIGADASPARMTVDTARANVCAANANDQLFTSTCNDIGADASGARGIVDNAKASVCLTNANDELFTSTCDNIGADTSAARRTVDTARAGVCTANANGELFTSTCNNIGADASAARGIVDTARGTACTTTLIGSYMVGTEMVDAFITDTLCDGLPGVAVARGTLIQTCKDVTEVTTACNAIVNTRIAGCVEAADPFAPANFATGAFCTDSEFDSARTDHITECETTYDASTCTNVQASVCVMAGEFAAPFSAICTQTGNSFDFLRINECVGDGSAASRITGNCAPFLDRPTALNWVNSLNTAIATGPKTRLLTSVGTLAAPNSGFIRVIGTELADFNTVFGTSTGSSHACGTSCTVTRTLTFADTINGMADGGTEAIGALGGDATDGIVFGRAYVDNTLAADRDARGLARRFYVGILPTTDMGAVLPASTDAGVVTWSGGISFLVDEQAALDTGASANINRAFDLDIDLDDRKIRGHVRLTPGSGSGDTTILLLGGYDANGLITGSMQAGRPYTNAAIPDFTTNIASPFGSGHLTGLIGQKGAVGVFFQDGSTGEESFTSGGFVVRPDPE